MPAPIPAVKEAYTKANIEVLLEDLRKIHPDLRQISVDCIVVADWVRFKCRYGCHAYGKHLCCPPFAPTPEETRRVISEYRIALLARFETVPDRSVSPKHLHHYLWDSLGRMHRTVFDLERKAFLEGYYKAIGFYALPCTLCETCVVEEKLEKGEEISMTDSIRCRHKDLMRPSMEACGIDVFKTLENAGYAPRVLKGYEENLEIFGMVLLD